MRRALLVAVAFQAFLVLTCFAGGNDRFELSLASVAYDRLEFGSIPADVQVRNTALSERAFAYLLERNLRFIYYNKLNRSRFLVAPDAGYLVDKIAFLYRSNEEIGQMLESALVFLTRGEGEEVDRAELRHIVGGLMRVNDTMKDEFESCFLDSHGSSYALQLPATGNLRVRLTLLLVESRHINRMVSRELDGYFLNESPGAVSLASYGRASLVTLMHSLRKAMKGIEDTINHRIR